MSGEKKPAPNPFAWVFRASVLLLGAVIALNVAIALLCPILPWLITGIALAATAWITIAIIRWRRSRW